MTIQKAIDRVFSIRPDSFSTEEKVEWLNTLDGQVYIETILTHENPDQIVFAPYDPSNLDVELLIPFPYDKVYLSYLKSMIAASYGENDEYNNAAVEYNKNMNEFKAYWNRRHLPVLEGAKTSSLAKEMYIYPDETPLERKI